MPSCLRCGAEGRGRSHDDTASTSRSSRSGKTDSAQCKWSLQDWNIAFQANVAMPVWLQSTMKKTSFGPNHCLLQKCIELDNVFLSCGFEDVPADCFTTLFVNCDANSVQCQCCTIFVNIDDSCPQCHSCTICSSDGVAANSFDLQYQ